MLDVHIVKQLGHVGIDISFSCEEGRLLALTGPSGCGKTTIIRTLAGLERPDSGHISFKQRDWYNSTKQIFLQARKRKVGYVFQEHTLFPHLTVRNNIGFACRDEQRVTELLELLRIRHLEDSSPQQISGGERQRAALAQALASDPEVLLLDEPFSALDSITRNRLRGELGNLKNRLQIPIILVTHDLDEARQLADHHICLEQGSVVPCTPKNKKSFIPVPLTSLPA